MNAILLIVLLIASGSIAYLSWSSHLNQTSEVTDTNSFTLLSELRVHTNKVDAAIAEGTSWWFETDGTITLSGHEIIFMSQSIEASAALEKSLRTFFESKGFTQDLNQAADGPGSSQSGFVNVLSKQRCLVLSDDNYVRDHETHEATWLSSTHTVFCADN